jgi:hypothetical protein
MFGCRFLLIKIDSSVRLGFLRNSAILLTSEQKYLRRGGYVWMVLTPGLI